MNPSSNQTVPAGRPDDQPTHGEATGFGKLKDYYRHHHVLAIAVVAVGVAIFSIFTIMFFNANRQVVSEDFRQAASRISTNLNSNSLGETMEPVWSGDEVDPQILFTHLQSEAVSLNSLNQDIATLAISVDQDNDQMKEVLRKINVMNDYLVEANQLAQSVENVDNEVLIEYSGILESSRSVGIEAIVQLEDMIPS